MTNWVFYSNVGDDCALYRINAEGNNKVKIKLDGDPCGWVSVADGRVYFCNYNDGGSLYRVRVNGREKQKLNDDECAYVRAGGDWVYYCNKSDGGKLYKIKSDGGGRTKLNDDESNFTALSDGWIYYCNRSDGHRLYKIRTDGSGRARLDDEQSFINVEPYMDWVYFSELAVDGGWLYYRNYSDGSLLYKMRIDGTEKTRLHEIDQAYCINVSDGWVYYCDAKEDYKICRIRADGSGREVLGEDVSCHYVTVAGDWIYYKNDGNFYNKALYKIRKDGSERTKLNTDDSACIFAAELDKMEPDGLAFHDFVDDSANENFPLWLWEACNGDSNSQYKLGSAYHSGGLGLEINHEKAEYWLRKSADQGEEDAIRLISEIEGGGHGDSH